MTDDRTLAVGEWFLDLITDAYERGRIDRRQYERYLSYLVRWTLIMNWKPFGPIGELREMKCAVRNGVSYIVGLNVESGKWEASYKSVHGLPWDGTTSEIEEFQTEADARQWCERNKGLS